MFAGYSFIKNITLCVNIDTVMFKRHKFAVSGTSLSSYVIITRKNSAYTTNNYSKLLLALVKLMLRFN